MGAILSSEVQGELGQAPAGMLDHSTVCPHNRARSTGAAAATKEGTAEYTETASVAASRESAAIIGKL